MPSPRSMMATIARKHRTALTKSTERHPYYNDPVGFFRDVLGLRTWGRQQDILGAVAVHPKVAVRSGHKIGKTCSAAGIALWWFVTRPRALVVMTSSTDPQIKVQLWPELQRLYRNALRPIGGTLHDTHHSGLVHEDGRRVIGISTNRTENMGGYSGAELLFIADEASGIEESIFAAIEGNRAGGAWLVMFGNPTKMSGTFYDAFHDKQEFWHTLHISSTETPNASGNGDSIPGLATREWIVEKTAELGGPGNPEWDIRIGGDFPAQGENSVIGSKIVEEAQTRWREPTIDDGPLEIGVDVARFGNDESVIQPRRGKYLYASLVFRNLDGPDLAKKVLEVAQSMRKKVIRRLGSSTVTGEDVEHIDYERPIVKIDSIGVGASPYDVLKRNKEIVTIGVDVGTAADLDEDYFNLRAQLWFALRDWFRDGGAFKPDSKTANELVAPIYKTDARGRYQVESKDDIRKRLHRSPDRADAMALAVYKSRAKMGAKVLNLDLAAV